ncbi:MAG: cell filamentation protein Fic [Ruminococcus sp.]|nr:cell filamentation protein Fic [Ruminococcus sp.]
MAVYSMEGTQKDCYPDTTVLINKLGIKDQKMLNVAEIRIVISMTAKIENEISFENVDFDFYKSLHHQLFSDLYEWAGKIRSINISKKGTVFCKSDDIERIGILKFKRLEKLNFLKNLNKEDFVEELTELYNDLNMLHPFREGNGRTLRLFVTLLVRNAGYNISFAECDSDFLMIATIKAAQGDTNLLREVFSEIVTS